MQAVATVAVRLYAIKSSQLSLSVVQDRASSFLGQRVCTSDDVLVLDPANSAGDWNDICCFRSDRPDEILGLSPESTEFPFYPLTVALQTTSARQKLTLVFSEIAILSQEQLSDALPPQSQSTNSAPARKPLPTEIGRFPGEAADGPVDEWLLNAVIPPPTSGPISVCLVVLWRGALPGYVDYFARSISFSATHGLEHCSLDDDNEVYLQGSTY
jgi:hypothetical protein